MPGTLGPEAAAQPWTTVGFWMIAVGAAYLLLIAARAFVNPKGFAAYLGLPLSDPADTGFVSVYAARPPVGHLDVLNGQGLPAAPAGTAARPGLYFLG
jgi:hypothetical protein